VPDDDRRLPEALDDLRVLIEDRLDARSSNPEVSVRRAAMSPSIPGQLVAITFRPRCS
jgi:hypothetical protein